jgi:hypothetical protein
LITLLGVYTLGQVDVGLSSALSFGTKLITLLDLSLDSPFGMLSLKDQISAEIKGLFGAQLSLSAAVANPGLYFSNFISVLAGLQTNISAGLGSFILDLTPQISANVSAVAGLQAKLSGILGLQGVLSLGKAAALAIFTELQAKLSAGGAAVYIGTSDTLPNLVSQLQTNVSGGLPGGFTGSAPAYLVAVVAENPVTIAALQFLFRATP